MFRIILALCLLVSAAGCPQPTHPEGPPPLESKFKYGDLVQLKSGGPPMVVIGIGNRYIRTNWMDVNNQLQSALFEEGVLVINEK